MKRTPFMRAQSSRWLFYSCKDNTDIRMLLNLVIGLFQCISVLGAVHGAVHGVEPDRRDVLKHPIDIAEKKH